MRLLLCSVSASYLREFLIILDIRIRNYLCQLISCGHFFISFFFGKKKKKSWGRNHSWTYLNIYIYIYILFCGEIWNASTQNERRYKHRYTLFSFWVFPYLSKCLCIGFPQGTHVKRPLTIIGWWFLIIYLFIYNS